jgi:hypothetical protein
VSGAANKAFFRIIEALLEERPDEWTNDHYYLTNSRAGVTLWIANAAYGLDVRIDGATITPSWWWKLRLRRAVDKHLAAKTVARLKAHVIAIAGEARRAETGNTDSAGTASTRAEGIAHG